MSEGNETISAVPTPGNTFVELTGEQNMATTGSNEPDGDLSNDSLELLTENQMGSFDILMTESVANGQQANSIVRFSGARKFNQEDPIEAAAVEMILQKP